MFRAACLLALFVALPTRAAAPPGPSFALRDGDTVVFLGDSITAARTYGKLVEDYTLLRFPDRKVRFLNAGRGGDTAAGGLKRLESDVFRRGATVLTVAYGINDIGWGLWADDKHRKTYLDAVAGIVDACRRHKVRVYICSAAVTGADPSGSEDSFLQKMCDEGMKLARSRGAGAIDVQRSMRAAQKRVWAWNEKTRGNKESLHAADGIHLNDLGQLAMAFAILKGLGAPAEVSSAVLDARTGRVIESSSCRVSDVQRKDGVLRFTRRDRGLPFNQGPFFALHYRFVPVPQELNRYLLGVHNLPAGRYTVSADGRTVGTYTAAQLAAGVNIASATTNAWEPGGPWAAQADVLRYLTEARDRLAVAGLFGHHYRLDQADERERSVGKLNAELEELQRRTARPRPYRFEVRRAQEKGR